MAKKISERSRSRAKCLLGKHWSTDHIKHALLRTLLGRLARPPAYPSVLINSGVSAELTAKKQRAHYMKLYLEFMAALLLGHHDMAIYPCFVNLSETNLSRVVGCRFDSTSSTDCPFLDCSHDVDLNRLFWGDDPFLFIKYLGELAQSF